MSNSNKSDSKSPRRRYFRRSKSEPPKPATDSSSSSSASEQKSGAGDSSEKPRRSSRKSRSDRSRSNRSRSDRSRSDRSRSDDSSGKSGIREERSDGKGRRENRNLKRRSNNDNRRRRRRRRHAQDAEPVEKNAPSSGPSIIDAIQKEYRSPQDVYSYTHVIRPDQRDAYEFRSDHFSNTSRHLEDYTIDLSSILDEAGEITLKHFFQEMPEDVDFEAAAIEEPHAPAEEDSDKNRDRPHRSTNDRATNDRRSNEHQGDDVGVGIEDDKPSAKSRRAERRKDAKRTPKQNVDDHLEDYFADDEKSLEQIYDELEMFTEDMEIK